MSATRTQTAGAARSPGFAQALPRARLRAASEKLSVPTMALTASVLLINFLPLYYFFPVVASVKFAFVTTVIFFSWLFAVREGVLKSLSDNAAPYLIFTAYYAYLVISVIFQGEHVDSYLIYVGLIVMQPMIVFGSIMLRNHKRSYLRVMAIMGFLFFVFIAFEVFFLGTKISVGYNFEVSYQTINMYLGMLSILIVTSKFKNWAWRTGGVVVLLIAVYMMFLAGGRGPVLAMAFSAAVYFFFLYRNARVKVLLVFLGIGVAGFAGGYLYDMLSQTSFVYRMSVLSLSAEHDTSSRIFAFTKAIELFKEYPIFGAGVNAFPAYINKYEAGWYPHNIFLEIAASLGLVGLLLFVSYVGYMFYVFIRYRKSLDHYSTQAFCVFIYMLVIYQFSGDMVAAWMFYLTLGMALPAVHLRSVRLRTANV